MSAPGDERTLTLNEARLRDLAEMSSDWFWEQDSRFRYTALWGRVYSEGRLNPNTTMGRCRWELGIAGVSEEEWRSHRAQLERHEAFRGFTYQFVNPQGETRWLAVNGKPVFDEQGDFAGYRGTGHDVTERKQAEAAALSREAELRLLLDSMPVAIGLFDRDLVLRFSNQGFKQLFSHLPGSGLGLTLREGLGEEIFAQVESHFRRALTGQPASYRRSDRAPDGAPRRLNVNLVPHWGDARVVMGCFSVTIDLTATERAEEQMRSLQTLFASTFHNTTDLMAIYRVDGKRLMIDGVNQALIKFYTDQYQGLHLPDWFGRPIDEFLRSVLQLDDADIDRRLLPFWGVVHSGAATRYRVALPRGDRLHQRDALVVPILDNTMRVTHLLYRGADITELVEKEEAVQALNAELERKVLARTAELTAANAELESFAYSVSHDLRSPLRAINGFGQLLLEDAGSVLDAQSLAHVQKMRDNTRRMGTLIDDMLKLANVTRSPFKTAAMDLSAIASQLAAELANTAPQRRVEWRIEAGVSTVADAGLMRQLLENLLSNAWKYSSGRDAACIEFGAGPGATPDGRHFFVRDNGAGFDMAYAGKLFQPFQRLHSPAEFEGSGIGLAIVARIVQRHGGTIRAEGAPGGGAAFYVELPAAEAAA